MIVTPAELDRRSQFYRELGQMTDSGITITKALETIGRHARRPKLKQVISSVLLLINQGASFGVALAVGGQKWLSDFDIALLGAGEQSGRLPACLAKLASYYEDRARLLRRLLASLAYPVFLIHVATVVFPISSLQSLVTNGTVFSFIASKILFLAPIYALAFATAFFAQGSRGEGLRFMLDAFLLRIPVVGAARKAGALSRLCLALEALINSGTNIIHSWELAGAASGSPVLLRCIRKFRPLLEAGTTPAEAVSMSQGFPDDFVAQIHSAEMSGKMDETLSRMHRSYADESQRKSAAAVVLLGGLVFGIVVITVAWQIIKAWTEHFENINRVLQ